METHTRNPLLLLRLCGLFLLRLAQRTLFQLLFQEPPRNYRPVPTARRRKPPGLPFPLNGSTLLTNGLTWRAMTPRWRLGKSNVRGINQRSKS